MTTISPITLQGVYEDIYGLQPHVKLFKDLNILARDEAFRKAAAVYPVTSMDDFYRLHAYFSRVIDCIHFTFTHTFKKKKKQKLLMCYICVFKTEIIYFFPASLGTGAAAQF